MPKDTRVIYHGKPLNSIKKSLKRLDKTKLRIILRRKYPGGVPDSTGTVRD